ncbi:MAG: alpha/beta fold hydrolase [Microthrixaceae bacterium]
MARSETQQSSPAPPAPRSQHIVDGLAVIRRRPESPLATVVLTHGVMDRAASFGRCMRRLDGLDVVAYDRRGYAGSLARGAADSMQDHSRDLLAVCEWAQGADRTPTPIVLVGHSLGGLITFLAAAERGRSGPSGGINAVGAYEAPMPWETATDGQLPGNAALDVARRDGAAAAAEYFYRAMVGDAAWTRLGDTARAARLAEGPALVSDLLHSRDRSAEPDINHIDATVRLAVGQQSPRHFQDVAALWSKVFNIETEEVRGAGHGAHLSHPGEFARWILTTAGIDEG